MCVIACCVKRRLTKDEFYECFKSNSDGVGISWYENGLNHYVKGLMDCNEAWAVYKSIPGVKHVVHFRLASAGSVCEELTHPFACDDDDMNNLTYHGDAPLLCHNGTVAGWRDHMLSYLINRKKRISGRMSDTRFVSMLLADVGDCVLDVVNGKWALFDKGNIYVWGHFEQENMILFSNTSYRPSKYGYKSSKKWDNYNNSWYNGFSGSAPSLPLPIRGEKDKPKPVKK